MVSAPRFLTQKQLQIARPPKSFHRAPSEELKRSHTKWGPKHLHGLSLSHQVSILLIIKSEEFLSPLLLTIVRWGSNEHNLSRARMS